MCCNTRKSKTDKLKAGQSLTVSGSPIKARDLSRIITITDDPVQQNPKAGSLKENILTNTYSNSQK